MAEARRPTRPARRDLEPPAAAQHLDGLRFEGSRGRGGDSSIGRRLARRARVMALAGGSDGRAAGAGRGQGQVKDRRHDPVAR
jgi:hypothetical protein